MWQIRVNKMMHLRRPKKMVELLITPATRDYLKIPQFQDDFILFSDSYQIAYSKQNIHDDDV